MNWLISYIAIVAGIFQIGHILDNWVTANPKLSKQLSTVLHKGFRSEPTTWLKEVSRYFINFFDMLYCRGPKNLIDTIWFGFFLTIPLLFLGGFLQKLPNAPSMESASLLIWALGNSAAFSLIVPSLVTIEKFELGWMNQDSWLKKGLEALKYLLKIGVALSPLFGVVFLINSYLFPFISLSQVPYATTIPVMMILIVSIIPDSIWPRVNPIKATVSSFFFILVIGLIKFDATESFFLTMNLEGWQMLGYLGFNVFADAVSLIETRWILKLAVNSKIKFFPVLILLDLFLSATIFLVLPATFGELTIFWHALTFQGESSWLGILFWTTFSTSFLFYLFVCSAVLSEIFAKLFQTLNFFSNMFDIEKYPVKCITMATLFLVTLGFLFERLVFVLF